MTGTDDRDNTFRTTNGHASKTSNRAFVLALFATLDGCDIIEYFGAFDWFVTMETGIDGKIIYKAMQVEVNGLLEETYAGRSVI